MTSRQITNALVTRHFDYRAQDCLPRCYFTGSEADLLVLRPSGWLEEVEIKIDRFDFKREFTHKADKHLKLQFGDPKVYFQKVPKEAEGHNITNDGPMFYDWDDCTPTLIRRFWFAFPADVYEKVKAEIPDYAGVLVFHSLRRCETIKQAPNLKHARKLTIDEQVRYMRLGCLRFWNLEAKEEVKADG